MRQTVRTKCKDKTLEDFFALRYKFGLDFIGGEEPVSRRGKYPKVYILERIYRPPGRECFGHEGTVGDIIRNVGEMS